MNSKYLKLVSFLLGFMSFCISCKEADRRPQPDTSHIQDPQPAIRLEKELFSIQAGQTAEGLKTIAGKYPELYDFYIKAVLSVIDTSRDQSLLLPAMDDFLHHPQMLELYDTVEIVFGDFRKYEQPFNQLIRNYKYYFPEKPEPRPVTFISQFGPKSFYYEPYLGIGLDLYLGKDYKYYPSVGFPDYFIKRLTQEYMLTDASFNLVQDMIEEPLRRGCQLIDMMVYYGKLYYVASYLLPDKPMKDFFYYSAEDWEWLESNEKEIWSFFIEGEWLYAAQYNQYRKFIEDGPTTLGMPQGAPDRVGRWTGYQMVKQYMERHPKTTLQELLAIEEGQLILSGSKYKPGN